MTTSASKPKESSTCVIGETTGCKTCDKPGRCNSVEFAPSDEEDVEDEDEDEELLELLSNFAYAQWSSLAPFAGYQCTLR